jgi:hypothetical protein
LVGRAAPCLRAKKPALGSDSHWKVTARPDHETYKGGRKEYDSKLARGLILGVLSLISIT